MDRPQEAYEFVGLDFMRRSVPTALDGDIFQMLQCREIAPDRGQRGLPDVLVVVQELPA
jgi:hypothetical protein